MAGVTSIARQRACEPESEVVDKRYYVPARPQVPGLKSLARTTLQEGADRKSSSNPRGVRVGNPATTPTVDSRGRSPLKDTPLTKTRQIVAALDFQDIEMQPELSSGPKPPVSDPSQRFPLPTQIRSRSSRALRGMRVRDETV